MLGTVLQGREGLTNADCITTGRLVERIMVKHVSSLKC